MPAPPRIHLGQRYPNDSAASTIPFGSLPDASSCPAAAEPDDGDPGP
ncbi:hypothetical protein [Streptomyces sp. NRRL F-5126]|nr:hypothetical protein [Streptomyces sp. NRRL F-5126]